MKKVNIKSIQHIACGLKLIKNGEYNDAYIELNKALEYTIAASLMQRAVAERMLLCIAKLNQVDRAIDLLKMLLEQDPEHEYYQSYIGSLYITKQEPDLALRYLKREISSTTPYAGVIECDISIAYALKGDAENAILHFQYAMEHSPTLLSSFGGNAILEIAKSTNEATNASPQLQGKAADQLRGLCAEATIH